MTRITVTKRVKCHYWVKHKLTGEYFCSNLRYKAITSKIPGIDNGKHYFVPGPSQACSLLGPVDNFVIIGKGKGSLV
jgi:hypothetical protein